MLKVSDVKGFSTQENYTIYSHLWVTFSSLGYNLIFFWKKTPKNQSDKNTVKRRKAFNTILLVKCHTNIG